MNYPMKIAQKPSAVSSCRPVCNLYHLHKATFIHCWWTWTYMTVSLSEIIPPVCLWVYFGIAAVKHLVKITFLGLLNELLCLQFNVPLLNKCVELKCNQIKLKLLLVFLCHCMNLPLASLLPLPPPEAQELDSSRRRWDWLFICKLLLAYST